MKKAENIFLDTNVFIRQKFNFNDGRLKVLNKLANDGFIKLFITEIIDREVQKNIKEIISTEYDNCKHLKSFLHVNKEDAITTCLQNYEKYKNENLTVLPCFDKDISKDIFDLYFKSMPPFDTNKKSKKHEFPDAYSIQTIQNWVNKNRTSATFLSSDFDFKTYLEKIPNISFETNIEKLLNRLNQTSNLYINTTDLFNSLKTKILNQVKKEVLDLSIYDYSIFFYSQRDYMEGCYRPNYELYDIWVDESSFIMEDEFNILDIDVNDNTAEIETVISYEADAQFEEENYEFAIYDKEDNKYYGVEYNTKEGRYLIKLSCYITINLKRKRIEHIAYDTGKLNPEIRFFEDI